MVLSALKNLEETLHTIEEWMGQILGYLITVIDVIGAVVIASGIIIALIHVAKRTKNERIVLARTTGLGLELIMCGEILRTITTRTKDELIILGIVVLIRGALALLSHWEFMNEVSEREKELEEVNKKVAEIEDKVEEVKPVVKKVVAKKKTTKKEVK